MKPIRSLAFALATLFLPAAVQAMQLTYDLRVDAATSSPGVTMVDAHTAVASGPGDVVGLQLYAVINGLDGDHTNDGFMDGAGSFVSSGGLLGDLRGDTVGQPATQINNVALFNFMNVSLPIAQSGFAADLDGDGDLDVGSTATSVPPIFPWFRAVSIYNGTSPVLGTGSGAGPTEFLIGRTVFTVSGGAATGQVTTVKFLPETGAFTVDGVAHRLNGNDPAIATLGANIFVGSTPGPQSPVSVTGQVTNLTATTATLNGAVNPNCGVTAGKFQYGLTSDYGTDVPVLLLPGNGGTPQVFSTTLTGLSPATVYHFRMTGTNDAGEGDGADVAFTTPAMPPPAAVTGSSSDFGATIVTLSATVNPNGGASTAVFQLGTTTAYGTDTPVTLSPNNGTATQYLSVGIHGLIPSTTYHYRISATNAGGTTNGGDQTFTTWAAKPPWVLESRLATAGTISVILRGSLQPMGSPTTAVFRFGPTTAYGTDVAVTPAPGDGMTIMNVSATLTGLTPGAAYHYILSATNSAGTTTSSDGVFITQHLAVPFATTYPATTIGDTKAMLNATVATATTDEPATAKFQYGLTTDYGLEVDLPGTPQSWVSAALTGLTPGTTYHYRISATNVAGTTNGDDVTFTTYAVPTLQPPYVGPTTTGLIGISAKQATAIVRALYCPNGAPCVAKFQVGTTTSYGTDYVQPSTGAITIQQAGANLILQPNTTYHYRFTATNAGGTTNGDDITFTTPPLPPAPVIGAIVPTQLAPTFVTLGSTINAGGELTTASFQYGLTTSYGMSKSITGSFSDSSTHSVSISVTGLTPNTTYHGRITATSPIGTTNSPDVTFTTPAVLPPPPIPSLTYEIRFDMATSSPGVTVVDPHNATASAPGDVVGVQLYAIVHGADGDHTNDGFTAGWGSFESTGGLLGDLRGDVSGQPATQVNNIAPFDLTIGGVPVAQSGFQVDLDGDGDLDVGSALTAASALQVLPWFIAWSSGGATPIFGTGTGTGPTEFLIGRTTFTVGAEALVGEGTTVDFLPFNRTDGAVAARNLHRFTSDGVAYALQGSDPAITTVGASIMLAAPVVPPPVVVTDEAKDATTLFATLPATVNPSGSATTAKFQWGLTTDYGNDAPVVLSPADGTTAQAVSVQATGLTPATTYHYRVVATNGGGTVNGEDKSFSTLALLSPEVISVGTSLLEVGTTSATLSGTLLPRGSPTTAFFQYGETTAYGTDLAAHFLTTSLLGGAPVSATVTGLKPNTTYHYRLSATNLAGTVVSADVTFKTLAATLPVAITYPATTIGDTGATLNAHVSTLRTEPATAKFQYGLTAAYGTEVVLPGAAESFVNTALTGLTPNTTYHFRISATNDGGTVNGDDMTFTTFAVPTPQAPYAGSATVQLSYFTKGVEGELFALMCPNGLPTTAVFQIGTTTSYGREVPTSLAPVDGTVMRKVQGPPPMQLNTTYHCRLVATNAVGTTYGPDTTFTTSSALSAPVIGDLVLASLTSTTATLNSSINPGEAATTANLEYGTSTSYGASRSIVLSNNSDGISHFVSIPLTGLAASTTYHCRISAQNGVGTTNGPDVTFSTPAARDADIGRGYYSGLLNDGAGSADGLVMIMVNAGGGFSGKVSLHGVSRGVQGTFHGRAAQARISGLGRLMLARDDAGGIDLTLGDSTGRAENAPYQRLAPAPMRGSYTVLLPPDPAHVGDAAFPQGTGVATLKVNQLGLARIAGRTGDGAPFAFESSVHGDGTLPCYDGLYTAPRGSIGGTLTFRDLDGSDLDGTLAWSKPAPVAGSALFRTAFASGFTGLAVPAVGSSYRSPATPLQMLAYHGTHPAMATFHDGGLNAPVSSTVTVSAAPSALVSAPLRKLTFSPHAGTFLGTLQLDATGSARRFFGIVFQKQNRGAGLFEGADTVGSLDYVPQPAATANR